MITRAGLLGIALVCGAASAAELPANTWVKVDDNGGGIRAGIDEGEITFGEVLTVLPFGNELCTVKLTGAQVHFHGNALLAEAARKHHLALVEARGQILEMERKPHLSGHSRRHGDHPMLPFPGCRDQGRRHGLARGRVRPHHLGQRGLVHQFPRKRIQGQ